MRYDRILLAQNHFWVYCRVREPLFYTEKREHLFVLCNTLNNLYKRKLVAPNGKICRKLMILLPPQHGKSRTLINFCQFALGRNSKERIILASYNDSTAQDFSKYTRNAIQEVNNDGTYLTFFDIFGKRIKRGTSAFHKWALEGEHFNYIGCGINGTVTGKGATILLIDDPVKGAIQALNDYYLEQQWIWYTSTFLSRVSAEGGEAMEIICMTPWSVDDIRGKVLRINPDEWYVLKMPAYNEQTGKMLCDDFLNYESWLSKKETMVPEIFEANYQMNPIEIKGTLYKSFKTYDELPINEHGISLTRGRFNYTDTADEGDCFLCSICYTVYKNFAYILDVYYTQEGMEITETETANLLIRNKVSVADIESNNGGRGFARNVQSIIDRKGARCHVKWFHQGANKEARIKTGSADVQNYVLFPEGWENMWPEFYKHLRTFKSKFRLNKYDDGADAITGVIEKSKKTIEIPDIRVSKPR